MPLSVRFVLSSRASYGATGRKGGGWGAGRTAGKAAANLARIRGTVRPFRARAQTPLQPFPHRVGRASCARPTWGSAQARCFPFFLAYGNAAACAGSGAGLSLAGAGAWGSCLFFRA